MVEQLGEEKVKLFGHLNNEKGNPVASNNITSNENPFEGSL